MGKPYMYIHIWEWHLHLKVLEVLLRWKLLLRNYAWAFRGSFRRAAWHTCTCTFSFRTHLLSCQGGPLVQLFLRFPPKTFQSRWMCVCVHLHMCIGKHENNKYYSAVSYNVTLHPLQHLLVVYKVYCFMSIPLMLWTGYCTMLHTLHS